MAKDKIQDIQNRLQFTMVIVLFFYTFMQLLFSSSDKEKDLIETGLNWGIVLGILIIVYFFIELIKKYKTPINKFIYEVINWGLLIEVLTFIPFLFIKVADGYTNYIFIIIYKAFTLISTTLMISIPLIIMVVIIINYFFNKKISKR